MVPPRMRDSLTAVKVRLLDLRDGLAGRRDRLTPTRREGAYVGAGAFRSTGDEALGLLVDLGGLRPEEEVLDIGCGIGRVARPLAGHLRAPGSYDGFDVVSRGVDWCAQRYVGLAAPFRFTTVDVSNAFYTPGGGPVPRSRSASRMTTIGSTWRSPSRSLLTWRSPRPIATWQRPRVS